MNNKVIYLLSHMYENVHGGAGTYANYLNEYHDSNSFDFYILTPDISESTETVLKIEKQNNFYSLSSAYKDFIDLHSVNYDKVIVHANTATELFSFVKSKYTLIANINDYEVSNISNLLLTFIFLYKTKSIRKIIGKYKARLYEKKVVENNCYVICNSNYTTKIIKNNYNCSNVFTIHKSVDLKKFDSKIQKDKNKIIFIGRDWQRKGLLLTLNSIALIKNKFNIELDLFIIGPVLSDKSYILKKCYKLGILSNIVFLGPCKLSETRKHLLSSSYFILPTYIEAFGISYLEAMAAKCIVIGSNVGGVSEIIDHDYNGLLLEKHETEGLAKLIFNAYNMGSKKKNYLIFNGLSTAEKYSSKNMIKKIFKIYNNL